MRARILPLCASGVLFLLAGCSSVAQQVTGAVGIEPEAVASLANPLILDVRDEASFARGHIPGARNVSFGEIDGYLHRVRPRGDRPVVVACEHGIDAALVAPTASAYGFSAVFALSGGMERWEARSLPLETGAAALDVDSTKMPEESLTRTQELVSAVTGLFLKPLYMLLALALVVVLRHRRQATPVRLLWHGMLWFFVGEAFCALNFLTHQPGRAYVADILHGVGMVVMSALVPWAIYVLADERVLRLSDPDAGCRIQPLCGRCWKRDPVRCALHDLMIFAVAGAALLSLMPLSLPVRPVLAVATVMGSPVDRGVPILNHLVEMRLYPVLGCAGFLITLAILLRGGPRSVRLSAPAFFVSCGFLFYSMLRFLLANAFRGPDSVWADFWEELTELFLVLGSGLLLYSFRQQLGLVREGKGAEAPPAATPGEPG